MKNINGILKIALGACLACGGASATTTLNFTSGSPQGSGTDNNDLSSYSVTVGGLTATAYAFYATGTSTAPSSHLMTGLVGEYNGAGMGVCQDLSGSDCNQPNHQIDNGVNGGTVNDYEFVLIAFTNGTNLTPVNLGQIQLGNYGTNGTTNDPFGISYYTTTSTASLASIESGLEAAGVGGDSTFTAGAAATCSTGVTALGAGGNNNGSYNDNCAVNGNGVETLTGSNVTYLLIGASTTGQGSDYFKIQDINANIATPEPASFAMIGLALLGLGLAGRRKFQYGKN